MTSALALATLTWHHHYACSAHGPTLPQVLLNGQWVMQPILQLLVPGPGKWLKLLHWLAHTNQRRFLFLRIWTETLRWDGYLLDGVETWSDKVRLAARVGTWQLKGMLTLNLWGTSQRRQVCREESGADGQRKETKRWERGRERRLLEASPGHVRSALPVLRVCAHCQGLDNKPSRLKLTWWVSDPYDWIIP